MSELYYKPCFLCRILGHKWFVKRKVKLDNMETEEVMLFYKCLRCGKDAPFGQEEMQDIAYALNRKDGM